MLRRAFLSALLLLGFQIAHAQFLIPSGPPASALSPTADGRLHGPPASALSLKPIPPGVNVPGLNVPAQFPGHVFFSTAPRRPFRRFESSNHRRHVLVPVPLFYPVYGPGYDYPYPSTADPNVSAADAAAPDEEAAAASNEDALRQAYLQGARDAMRHDLEAAQQAKAPEKKPVPKKTEDEAKDPPEPDDSPATVFIFKDGHQIETKNFAIMGKTLFDLSGSTLRKVQLNDLDSAATLKANDDRGIQVKLP